jgi:hypothetical protein
MYTATDYANLIQKIEEGLQATDLSSYLGTGSEGDLFPQHAIDLKCHVGQTPPFLGDGLASDEEISFSCEEKQSI